MTYFGIYSDFAAEDELMIEAQGRVDYYAEAYAGLADDPATLRFEAAALAAEEWIKAQDEMEARGGPAPRIFFTDEIPF